MAPEGAYSAIYNHVLPEYEDWLKIVEIVPLSHLMRPHVSVTGWRTQQSLKLLVSRLIDSPNYLILDAKNHFIRPISSRFFVENDGRMRTFRVKNHGSLGNYLTNCLNYFDIQENDRLDFSLPATTPYVVSTRIVREMLLYIENREGCKFDDFFHAPGQNLTEFFLYFTYLLFSQQAIEKLYKFSGRTAVTLFTRWPSTTEQLQEALKRVKDKNVVAFGLHRNRIPSLAGEFEEFVRDLWVSSGLFSDTDAAQAYLSQLKGLSEKARFEVVDRPISDPDKVRNS
jgi:hypothetical protein